jgi:hypothetical protein
LTKSIAAKASMLNRAGHKIPNESPSSGTPTDRRKILAYITGIVNGEMLLRREYRSAENRL